MLMWLKDRRRRRLPRRGGMLDRVELQGLEPRLLLSTFTWTAEEVYLLELVNRARLDPAAEEARLNQMPGDPIDLTQGLTSAEAARLGPMQPLAMNEALTLASRAHSLDMGVRDFFDHNNPDGQSPTDRAQAAGYGGSAGENIAAGYRSIDDAHRAWILSVGHRKNVFSLHSHFTSTFHYKEFGAGFAFDVPPPAGRPASEWYFDFYTQLFGVPQSASTRYILGVVFNDANSNGFYNIGEGMGNVRITITPQNDPFNIIGTYTTSAAGNYQLQVPQGSYTVTFTNLANNRSFVRQAVVQGDNVKVDATAAQLVADLDDHANAGNFAAATEIPIHGTTGVGAAAGTLEHPEDTDLFQFTAAATGVATVRLTGSGTLAARLTVLGPTGSPLGVGIPGEPGESIFAFNVVGGERYFVLASSDNGAGLYAISILSPVINETTSPGGFIAGPDATLNGSPAGSGALTLTLLNDQGRPIVFQQRGDGTWTALDLVERAGGPAVTGKPMTWTDPKDGRTYIASTSAAGLMLYVNTEPGVWTARNLTVEIDGAPLITGVTTSFIDVTGRVFIAGLADSGDMILYQQTGGTGAGGFAWTAVNLTQRDLAPQGLSTPAYTGDLISFVTGWNALNIAGLDAQGNIIAVWWAPGLDAWSVDNLSQKTGAPPIAGGLTAFLTPWGGMNLAGVNADGELTATWWVPQFGPDWATSNLTLDADGPTLRPDSVASFVTGWGGLNVVAADESGRLVTYWWAPEVINVFGEDKWQIAALSEEVADGPRPEGPLNGVSFANDISIVGAQEESRHIFRYWWEVGGAWQAEDLTAIATPG